MLIKNNEGNKKKLNSRRVRKEATIAFSILIEGDVDVVLGDQVKQT